ncbi:transcriptional modulator of MazE/toxin, MazF [Cyanobacterium stanieri PCC 7202]|uniref:Transcriptional modulator of MazE/toxin, MazF n=1 Tax=Cyanobacterium stanieri (strain ATCC 29140 / PCC 7202) TaxID=292563 RepID=K9YNN3_CYASC|nr:transcriptional modulator of MazE/toxin, MazF [Cyanobacterium stanieri PCC 7202]
MVQSGDIVLIRFPQTNLKEGKLRPALVVANSPHGNEDVLLALISSRIYQTVKGFDIIIKTSDDDYIISGLKVDSVIRLGRLVTIESSIINARLGSISQERLKQVRKNLINWLKIE